LEPENQRKFKLRKISTALLMAAGMGTRIRPLSQHTPKPLIPVKGTPIIETIIQSLINAGINNIIITIGYKKEMYQYLGDKYGDIIRFVENIEYMSKNTISSFYAAMELLRDKNCIICESDLYISDSTIITGEMDKSRYFLRNVSPQNYEWGFELDNDIVKKVVRPNSKVFLDHHMYGIAYWMKEDLELLINATNKAYQIQGHEDKAYDEIGNEIFDKIDMGIIRINSGQLDEVDCINDLIKLDPSYNTYLNNNQSER
jgi:MurNAc alpha-1-phosphate uridylyltransferase